MAATLLLADDSITIQRVVELTFATEDVDVVAVADGDGAIERLASSPPDIVLADVNLPGKTGYEIAQHVKRTPALAHIPVVLLTGAFDPVDRGRAAAVGCDAVLAKPFEPQVMIARVRELLHKPPAPEPEPPPRRPDLDAYFDELDAAFAHLATGPVPRPPDMESQPAFEAPAPPIDAPAPPSAAGRIATAMPSIADAFAALLAAETRSTASLPAAGWPIPSPAAAAPLELDDETIRKIASRVAAQLSDQFVRAAVTDIVTSVAERLVREEIDRIKASM